MGLPRRPFGSTGLEASVLGLGGAWIGLPEPDVSEAQAVETVRRAIDLGVSYVDTSPLYGESERRIGLALSGGRREKVLLSTKTGTRPERRYDYSSDATRWSVDLSLRALRTDVLDVVLIHDPPGRESVFEEGAALDALESLREEGVLRFIGVGVRDHALLAECILSGRFDVVLTYLDYNLISQTAGEKVLPLAQEKGVAVLNGSPFYMGLLADRDPSGFARRRGWPGEEKTVSQAEALVRWAGSRGIELPALALRYSLADPRVSVTLVGARSPDEMERSVRYATAPLPTGIWEELERDCGVPRPP